MDSSDLLVGNTLAQRSDTLAPELPRSPDDEGAAYAAGSVMMSPSPDPRCATAAPPIPHLLKFLELPPDEQKLHPDTWMEVWEQICAENDWLAMRREGLHGDSPHCTLCCRWAETTHLLTPDCQAKVTARGRTHGPLLAALLAREPRRRGSPPSPSAPPADADRRWH